jgi:hypothetical protein
VNLDFEQSTILSTSPTFWAPDSGTANVLGWNASASYGLVANYSRGTVLNYNSEPLDSAGVSLVGTDYSRPAIQGQYSIWMTSGTEYVHGESAAIWQIGQIPATAKSITYWGLWYDSFEISFNAHVLSFNTIHTDANYSVFGADISAYAGQTGELLFAANPGYGMIDNIQFSPSAIPEPSVLSTSSICILLLYWRI